MRIDQVRCLYHFLHNEVAVLIPNLLAQRVVLAYNVGLVLPGV